MSLHISRQLQHYQSPSIAFLYNRVTMIHHQSESLSIDSTSILHFSKKKAQSPLLNGDWAKFGNDYYHLIVSTNPPFTATRSKPEMVHIISEISSFPWLSSKTSTYVDPITFNLVISQTKV